MLRHYYDLIFIINEVFLCKFDTLERLLEG